MSERIQAAEARLTQEKGLERNNNSNNNPTHGTTAHSSFGGGADGMNGLSGMAGMADLELSEQELVALSLEAERKLKPFACGVGDCPRRYKNMNGLR